MKKYALISVYNKKNIEVICKFFLANNIGIISTGSTASIIRKYGYKCQLVSDLTKYKEILDGRVKTLHPNVHASLLFKRNNHHHRIQIKKTKFPIIDYVVVNLYPFNEFQKNSSSIEECIEMIDIGGPTLLRSAAKNYQDVTAICDVNDYNKLINNFKLNRGSTNLIFRKKMAQKVFKTTYQYDKTISDWLRNKNQSKEIEIFYHEKKDLRYGENPHQKSFLYTKNTKNNFVDNLLHGKELSYNNLLDIDIAFNCVNEFVNPTCVIIKHNSPCGASSDKIISKAFVKAVKSDPISSFGGVIAFNSNIDNKTAELLSKNFYEVVLAPMFSAEVKKILTIKKNIRLIKTSGIKNNITHEIKSINDGYLVQEKNNVIFKKNSMQLVSNYNSSNKEIDDLIFAFKICKYVKSNAIVLANNQTTVSIGGGQTSRIDATKIAIKKIKNKQKSFVASSDAFFPFTDSIKLLIKRGCRAIIQPGGSLNDKKIINIANKNKLGLYFSKYRFFKH